MLGYRFQTSGFDTEPFLGEPRNPPYYEKLWTTFGFERKSTWSSYDLKASDLTDARGAMEGFLQGDLPVAVEDFDLKNLDVELKEFYPVASESYSNNFGYSASDAEELDWLFRPLTGVFSQGTFCKARNKEGRVVGFAFGYWDLAPAFIEINGDDQKASLLNEFVPKRFLIHTIAMAKSYQRTVATYQVMYQLMKYVIAAGTPAVGCLTKEGGRTVYDKAGAATRTYSVYAKTLS
ncbi:MAG: hypothetical protein EOP48_15350 [Sphingobacteriales bacterium]|nr:MAG: hypothetical protein EOP48_15350 [Sphingobacteriales bacterium]